MADIPFAGDETTVREFHRWWDKSVNPQTHEAVFTWVETVEEERKPKMEKLAKYLSGYAGEHHSGDDNNPGRYSITYGPVRISLNVIQSVIDAARASIGMSVPRPMFLTDDGNYDDRQKAKGLQEFCDGAAKEGLLEERADEAELDGTICGLGCVRAAVVGDEVVYDRVTPENVIVDEVACGPDTPRTVGLRFWVPAEVMAARYPKFAEDIWRSAIVETTNSETMATTLVEVLEIWHLPSKDYKEDDEKHDGAHAICVRDATLLYRKYNRQRYPAAFYRWQKKPRRWFGQGLAEQLEAIQTEINRTLSKISSQARFNAAYLLKPKESKIPNKHFTDQGGVILEYEGGRAPEMMLSGIAHPQMFQYLWDLVRQAYSISGVGQFGATATKPPEVRSGAAMRALTDVESKRHIKQQRTRERFRVELYEITVDVAKEAHEDGVELNVRYYSDREHFKIVDFDDVDMSADRYVIDVWPTSQLPETPGAKIETVMEFMSRGLPWNLGLQMLNFPDTDAFVSLETAELEFFDKIFDMLIEGEQEAPPPEIWMNLQMGMRRGYQTAVKEMCRNTSRDRVDRLLRWVEQASQVMKFEQEKQQQEMLAQQMAMQAAQQPPPEAIPPEMADAAQEAAAAQVAPQ